MTANPTSSVDREAQLLARFAEDPRDDDIVWMTARPIMALAAGANIVMQLGRLGVGRGVAESTVETGRLDKHPIKRARTTFGYVMVAMLGTDEERAWLREEVNRSHRPVHATGDVPVRYNAFDPDLQLWVAACICKGVLDIRAVLDGGVDEAHRDRIVAVSQRIGTTLQVDPAAWPADAAAFDEYWRAGLAQVAVDEVTQPYLVDFLHLRWLGWVPAVLLGRFHTFVSTGFLSEEFREPMRLPWSPRHQRWFDRFVAAAVVLDRFTPGPLATLGPKLYLADFRRRRRRGKPFT